MATIIKVIIGILITTIIFSLLIYVYNVPIQKMVIIGFLIMIFVMLLAGMWYAYKSSENEDNKNKMKTPGIMNRMEELWIEIMGVNNNIELYTGEISSIVWEDDKKYSAGVFDAISGRHQGTQIVLIYCVEDDDLVLVAPSPSPRLIDNPFHNFEPKRYGRITRDRAKEEARHRDKGSLVNVNLADKDKEDPNKKENDEFEKNIGK